MSQSTDEQEPPVLVRNDIEVSNESAPTHPLMELELARLRIKELEMRMELARISSSKMSDTEPPIYLRSQTGFDSNMARAKECNLDLPKRDVKNFNGDPKRYCVFIKEFETTIEQRTTDDQTRLHYLTQYCDGPARNAIEHCLMLPSTEGYQLAKATLRKRFGQNYMVARAFIDELLDGPELQDDDSQAMIEFSQQLKVCEVTLRQLNYLADLNSSRTIEAIVCRLPSRLRFKWAKTAGALIQLDREAEFKDLVTFVEKHADTMTTRYSELAVRLKYTPQTRRRQPITVGSRKSVHTITTESSNSYSERPVSKCLVCDGSHHVEQCSSFLEMNSNDRLDCVRKRGLCHVCLKFGHIAKFCKSQRGCSIDGCGWRHHMLLHDTFFDKTRLTPIVLNHHTKKIVYDTTPSKTTVVLAIVPVTVRAGNRSVQTLAFIDAGSDSTFVSDSLVNALALSGRSAQLQLSTMTSDSTILSKEFTIEVISEDDGSIIPIKRAWSVRSLPALTRINPSEKQTNLWPHLKNIQFPDCKGKKVEILLGADVPEAHWVLEQRIGTRNEPYAVRTSLGWMLLGPFTSYSGHSTVNFTQSFDLEESFARLYAQDFGDDDKACDKKTSFEDRQALSVMDTTVRLVDNHYEVALPWRSDPSILPNNKPMVLKRLQLLKNRFLRDHGLLEKYTRVMNEYILLNHAEKVISTNEASWKWYLPHHPVFHPAKPDKLRIVFDCAAEFRGFSLNKILLSGPDMSNSLVGVLLRFRRERIAVMADIKSMFHQVKVPLEDRNAFRFLWWTDGKIDQSPTEYQMNVHLFGATSSPSCANFVLKRTIEDNQALYPKDVIEMAKRCFYVDDCLYSVSSKETAHRFAQQMKDLLGKGGFNLTKWFSNDMTILSNLPTCDQAIPVVRLNLDEPLIQRTLGLDWELEKDVYKFHARTMDTIPTRRSILSFVSSFFDPLGYLAPVTLTAKFVLQQLCHAKLNWDTPIDGKELKLWNRWIDALHAIEYFSVPRCIIPNTFTPPFTYNLHVFCDASETGYGAVAYIVIDDSMKRRHAGIIYAKARVAPLKKVTIPRLELMAAVTAARLCKQLLTEIDLPISSIHYWTDSIIVLQSIRNMSKRFQTFVANRLMIIHEMTNVADWKYIDSKRNPADLASRGILADDLKKLEFWIHGPSFLVADQNKWPILSQVDSDCEPKCFLSSTNCATSCESKSGILSRFEHIRSWNRLQRSFAWLLRFKGYIKKESPILSGPLRIEEIRKATSNIIKLIQSEAFFKELNILRDVSKLVLTKSPLRKLRPFLCDDILRVKGRLMNSTLPFDAKHPIILPSNHFVSYLLIQQCHEVNGHMGISYVLSALRQRYWIINATKLIRTVITKCQKCKRWLSSPCKQVMAPLPADRLLSCQNPFTICGIDYFGPMYVKRARAVEKRYGCLFTCFSSRAVHIEVSHSLDTDSFLCAFNRFVARRGCPQRIYSDNGSNFKGAHPVIQNLLRTWNQEKITKSLQSRECDWIFNPPLAHHRGGVWERIIRSIKSILLITLEEQPMTDEVLLTTLLEIERILNDRPLVKQLDDPDDQYTLCPNKLLLLQSNPSVPVVYDVPDRFNRRWRQAQFLADQFWKKWIKRYLPILQLTQRWLVKYPELKNGELVLVVEKCNRGQWPKAVVEEVIEGTDGIVREVLLRTQNGRIRRDIRHVCRLEGNIDCEPCPI